MPTDDLTISNPLSDDLMIGAAALELALDLADAALEIIDQRQAGVDVPAPGLGDLQAGEQLAVRDPEQV